MKKIKIISFLLLNFCFLGFERNSQVEITELKCQSAIDPMGIDSKHPSFSWIAVSQERGKKQKAYQILISDRKEDLIRNKGTFWDSGKIKSEQTNSIYNEGKPLISNRTYYWKVRIWDEKGEATAFSNPACFTTSILDPLKWQAGWIGRGDSKDPDNPDGYITKNNEGVMVGANPEVPVKYDPESIKYDEGSLLLRKKFISLKQVSEAIVHICGLGLYELEINGERIGDKVLNPAKTNYCKVVLYDTYDVSEKLREGENVLAITLGNGWFNPLPQRWNWRGPWFGEKRAMLQMHINYTDGSSQVIITDDSWKLTDGPVRRNGIYDGEIYDATKEIEGWNKPGFNDAGWKNAKIVASPKGNLAAQSLPAIQRTEAIKPVSITFQNDNISLVDFGQNFAGWIRIKMISQDLMKLTQIT